MNARFWIYYKGDCVKITLRPGQMLDVYEGGKTDEGFSHTWTHYHHIDGTELASGIVERITHNQARDCDGRHNSTLSDFAYRQNLAQGPRGKPGHYLSSDWIPVDVVYPYWQESEPAEVRDEFAEAAGY